MLATFLSRIGSRIAAAMHSRYLRCLARGRHASPLEARDCRWRSAAHQLLHLTLSEPMGESEA